MKSKFGYAIIVFVVSLITLVILALLFQQRISKLLEASRNVEHSNQVIIELNRLEHFMKEAESAQRGFMLTNDSSYLEPYFSFSKRIIPAATKIQQLTTDNIATQNRIIKLRGYVSKRMETMHFALQSFKVNDSLFESHFLNGKLLMDTCQQILRQLEQEQTELFDKSNSSRNFYAIKTPENFRNLFLVSLLLLVLSFVLIMREIMQRSRYQRELQANIIELNQTYEELQQITFITSHDFQEPLRKIRIMSSRLTDRHWNVQDEEGSLIITRIQAAAGKIQELIQEMVQYMALSRTTEKMTEFNLTSVVNEAAAEMNDHPAFKKATLNIRLAVAIVGYRSQIRLLFKSLIDNAIKYSHPDRELTLDITGEISNSEEIDEHTRQPLIHYKVIVSDNGIGFEQEFSRKIFHLFKRLETGGSTPDGKGVGLALAEKIMANHKGYIQAEGVPGKGAKFILFFPVKTG